MIYFLSFLFNNQFKIQDYPPPDKGGFGGGGGGGISPSSPQQACGVTASSAILVGVQETITILRKTVTKMIYVFFIFVCVKI